MKIRQIREEDFEGYHRCLDEVACERKYLAMYEGPPREGSLGWVKNHIAKDQPLHVAVDEGEIVGWCDITPLPREVFAHRAELGMGLLKRYRGQGKGSLLAESAIAHARKMGIRRIDLDVRADNEAAIKLYRALGFIEEGRIKDGIRREDEGFEDVILMGYFTEWIQ